MKIEDIYTARDRIRPYLMPTPLLESAHLKRLCGKSVWLKLETQLPTGTFKPRPAFNSILAQLDLARQHGVITLSSGNFAQGAAFAARELNVSAIVVMTKNTSPYKIQRTKDFGADVVLCGNSQQEKVETTLRLQKETGRVFLHPYDTQDTIAGDGTLALELIEQLGERLNHDMSILVPVSGGGLIAGIAYTLKTLNYKAKIIGIQPSANTSLIDSLKAGHCVASKTEKTIADALTSSPPGENAFQLIRDFVDDIVLIDETTIQAATRFFLDQHKLVVEPSGAVPVAALMANKVQTSQVICVTSGGNINLQGITL